MRIQHNIMAMNSYRNLGTNNTALSKNLEKLSSGYRINRAGDDAAGLAISEKMRAQISGLDQAQKNAQSGINLVKTAEGALTEVHDMLNRMTTLATQSANGTYGATDRAKIQAEVDALTEEINRIAENSNFNGTKLLDGSLASGNVAGDIAFNDTKVVTATATSGNFAAPTSAQAAGDTFSYTVAWTEDGAEKSKTVNFKVNADADKLIVLDEKGNETTTTYSITKTKATKTEIQTAVFSELKKDGALTAAFDIETATDALKFTSKVAGADGAKITALGATATNKMAGTTGAGAIASQVEGKNAMQKLDLSKVTVITGTSEVEAEDIEKATFEVDGQKFLLVGSDATATTLKNVDADVHMVKLNGTSYTAANDASKLADELTRVTGQKFEYVDGTKVKADTNAGIAQHDIIYKGDEALTFASKGLDLQIGADSVEKINVKVEDMGAAALGIEGLDISTVENANKAIDTIKAAIEKVSVTRGDLGAVQNRLEHTINNLGVMEENIQDAESNIRDTDIADEMMAYTKNNILIQSAQAMLAQANQVPQGVLQLMQ